MSENDEYYSDSPIESKNEDCFGRIKTAKAIFETIKSFSIEKSYTIGVYGSWGAGKTSVVNLLKELYGDTVVDEGSADFFCIDAWNYSGNTFGIQAEIARKILNNDDDIDDGWLKKIKRRKFLGRIKRWGGKRARSKNKPNINLSYFGVSVSSSFIIDGVMRSMDEHAINKAIRKKVREKKIIISIDNIDRLNGKDIIELLGQINRFSSLGRGLYFLLPFDKEYVSKMISAHLPPSLSGEAYIDKIVQIPVDLPVILQEELDDYFGKKLQILLSDLGLSIEEDDWERFVILYRHYGLNKYISTPRDAVRLVNSLRFSLIEKQNKINVVDFIVLEIIRVFDKEYYNMIFENKKLIINNYGDVDSSYIRLSDEEKKEKVNSLCNGSAVGANIMLELFPRAQRIIRGQDNGSDDEDELRQKRRAASFDYFDLYFSISVGITKIDDDVIMDIVKNSMDKSKLDKKILAIDASNYRSAFRKFRDHQKEIVDKINFSKALLDLADVCGYSRRRDLSMSLFDSALFFIDDLLRGEDNKLEIYKQLLRYNYELGRAESIPFLIRQVVLYSNPERSRNEPNLTNDELREYKKYALDVIREMADKDMVPWDAQNNSSLIYIYWEQFGNREEINTYVRKHVITSDGVINFITQFLGISTSMSDGISYRSDVDSATLKTIQKYVDLEYFYDLISRDSRYDDVVNAKEKKFRSFSDPFNRENKNIGRVGNERTEDFRKVVVEQFIYQYDKLGLDDE